ncbi:hypothetical protein HY384_00540 [Candidatus Daviesbacteria bacterium]|nr:hypothetical protein [Candidatus Daviesbacteria bacterium]
MNKKTILLLLLTLVAIVFVGKMLLFSTVKKNPLSPFADAANKTQILPSKTMKLYTDPAGFTFNYPDDLSLAKNEILDPNFYTDIQLTSKEIEGSLFLKISDTKFANLDEWLKSKQIAASSVTETKLGNLLARQFQLQDKIMVATLDQGVLFTLEIPENEYWMSVFEKVAADFSFSQPEQDIENSSTGEVIFEGEEIVE